jgi:hypothetical protein
MSNLAQQFNSLDETHLAMSCPKQADDAHIRFLDEQQRVSDHSTEYVEQLKEEIEGLRKKLDIGTEEHMADTAKLNAFCKKKVEENEKLKEENESLKRQECVNLRDTLKIKLEYEEKIEKLTEETKMWRLSGIVMREFTDPKGYYTNIEDYVAFDEFIKGHYPEEYEDLYEWFDIDSQLYEDEDEE